MHRSQTLFSTNFLFNEKLISSVKQSYLLKISINSSVSQHHTTAMATLHAILASVSYVEIIIATLCFFFLICLRQINQYPHSWPLVGMLPLCFPITRHIFDQFSEILERTNGTFEFKGPLFGKRDMIFTADPRNVQHILSTNFSAYPKGPDTKKIFEAYGEMLFTADLDVWRSHRKLTHAFLHNQLLSHFTIKINQEVLQKGLIPVLDHSSEKGLVVDLQDVFQRYMLDSTWMMITGYNRGSLRVGFSEDIVLKALHDASDAILMRHILPEIYWKFESWLGFGIEKELSKACKILDATAEEYVKRWKDQGQNNMSKSEDSHQDSFNLFKFVAMHKELVESVGELDKVMKEAVTALVFGGTDTTSPVLPWLFWLLFKNPVVERKIRNELAANFQKTIKSNEPHLFFHPDELNKLVYLHAALCEALRLFPSIPFQPRTSTQHDILPSGHSVKPSVRVVICTYAMGRMKSVWGEDCLEFKPERWISEQGGIKPVPSNKFMAFSSGPRICMGKEMALNRLKAVAATILYNYQIQIIEDQPSATPATSIILHLKHGLLAKVGKGPA